jgi:hypothetical protein
MKKLIAGLASLPLLASVAMAEQPTSLSDAQMDRVSAGATEIEVYNRSPAIGGTANFEATYFTPCGSSCYQLGDDPHNTAIVPNGIVVGTAANFEFATAVNRIFIPGVGVKPGS